MVENNRTQSSWSARPGCSAASAEKRLRWNAGLPRVLSILVPLSSVLQALRWRDALYRVLSHCFLQHFHPATQLVKLLTLMSIGRLRRRLLMFLCLAILPVDFAGSSLRRFYDSSCAILPSRELVHPLVRLLVSDSDIKWCGLSRRLVLSNLGYCSRLWLPSLSGFGLDRERPRRGHFSPMGGCLCPALLDGNRRRVALYVFAGLVLQHALGAGYPPFPIALMSMSASCPYFTDIESSQLTWRFPSAVHG